MGARLAFLAAGALVFGAGCDITLPGTGGGEDAATDADATTDAAPQTVGDQCTTIVTDFCARVGSCTGAALADCLANDMPMCCGGSACGAVSQSSAGDVGACTSAIAAEDCYSVSQGLPAACQGVPQMP